MATRSARGGEPPRASASPGLSGKLCKGLSLTGRRVLHLVSSLQVGGMEQFVLRIAALQRKRGIDARILALRPGPLQDSSEAPIAILRSGSGTIRAISAL